MEKEKTCCITGHRELTPEQGAIAVVKLMTELLQAGQDGYTTVITGMAKGVDLIAAEDVLLLKNKIRPELQLVAAISHRDTLKNKDQRFQRLLKACDRVVVLSEYYHPGVFDQRNRWMLEQSSRLIAAYDGRKTGGTVRTMQEAEQLGLEIRKLDLNSSKPEPHHRKPGDGSLDLF